MYTIKWEGDAVSLLDQRLLPQEEKYLTFKDHALVAAAIRDMAVRGAPAIGITAAMGIALAAKNSTQNNPKNFQEEMTAVFDLFGKTRPTAVNLFWAIERMKGVITRGNDIAKIKKECQEEALAIYNEDIESNKAMGKFGSRFLKDGDTVMTHCNAGSLATGGYGTALGVIRAAIDEGKKISVIACETRPYLQGARLTAWELYQDNIPVTLITDSMAAHFMKKGDIQAVVVGADRIAANGDTANKIGTYGHSLSAMAHSIPFYIAAPLSTIDMKTKTGADIPIEERSVDEVAYIRDVQIAPEGVSINNPAFDVTPAKNISAIVTEKGVVEKPSDKQNPFEGLLK
jgi:methylthioribose-1-phosphate isomerase